jgi:hypothetical protein
MAFESVFYKGRVEKPPMSGFETQHDRGLYEKTDLAFN